MLKFDVDQLVPGELVWAIVVEPVGDSGLIVDFSGDLVRVDNQTHMKMRVGQRIGLRVKALKPLEFALEPSRQLNWKKRKIDLSL